MAQDQYAAENALVIDRLATQLAKDPHSKAFMPLAEEYGKVGMWQEAAGVLEDGLKLYPGFITAMVALGRAYDHMGQSLKAKAILEESVKLSPENLRAHRTLIRIYQSQGLNDSALQSCAVILAVNPRDEEALSVQTALGGSPKQHKEQERPKSTAPAAQDRAAQTVAEPLTSAERTAASPNQSDSIQTKSDVASTDPLAAATEPIGTARSAQSQIGEQLMEPEPDSQTTDTIQETPPLSHAEVVAQLESWLHSIKSRRHDRDATNEPRPKVS
jgi:tetratricopeptide (TPR) repeat protein